MIRHYFIIAWRNLQRSKSFSMINIGGLAIGMTVALLIGLWIHSEFQYDREFNNYNQIAQVMRQDTVEGKIVVSSAVPVPLMTLLKTRYRAYFKHIVITSYGGDHILDTGNKPLPFSGLYMDAGADEMLSLRLRYGQYGSLSDPSAILISQSAATSLFGSGDPVGRSLKIDNQFPVKVTGVYEDLPQNSSFSGQDFIASWNLYTASNNWVRRAYDEWTNNSFQIYVQLADRQNWNTVRQVMATALNSISSAQLKNAKSAVRILPMRDWHLRNQFDNGVQTGGLITQVHLFGVIGLLVLLIACINFMNLSTARSEKRAKEVGIRKAVGSVRKQLTRQFYFEAFLISLIAAGIAIITTWLTLPWFNHLYTTHVGIPWSNGLFWLAFLTFIILTTLVAGSYPALYLSSVNAITALKGRFKAGKSSVTSRKLLIVGQFSISLVLIIATCVIYRQIQYAQQRNPGYIKDQLIGIQMKTTDFYGKYDLIRNTLLNNHAITDMAESSSPLTGVWSNSSAFFWEGKGPDQAQLFGTIRVTYHFGSTVNWQILAGRDFSQDYPSDSTAIVLNEAAVRYMGLKHPVGSLVRWGEGAAKGIFHVIGVARDMVMASPYAPTGQMIFFIDPENVNWMILRLNTSAGIKNALAKTAAAFKKYIPAAPFEYHFVDQQYARKFAAENRTGSLAALFATLAIFICCIGLFGLASFMTEQRIKEIGIRKVMGASVIQLWIMLSKNFMYLILLSSAIAIPLGWYLMHGWLRQYAYQTPVSGWLLFLPALFAFFIAFLTVSWHAVRAASANPVQSLKTE